MFDERFNTAKNQALNQAIENYKTKKRGSFKILKLIKTNIEELIQNGLNMQEQINIINTALDIKIAYSTYKAFYYAHINKVKKKSDAKKQEKQKTTNIDLFADLTK
jgi:DNA invertase Pin-like site-specific DNA recombinase